MSLLPTRQTLVNSIFFLSMMALSQTTFALDFVVKESSGDVTWYNLRSATFEPVKKNQILSDGTLIHVATGGTVKFESSKNSKNEENDVNTLQINAPGVIRLPEKLRVVDSGEYPLKDLPTGSGESADEKPVLGFRQAWERLTAVLNTPTNKNKLPKVTKEATDLDFTTAGFLGSIKWQYPLGDLTLHSSVYPRNLEIYWKSESAHGGNYRVYLWPTNKNRQPAIDHVRTDRYVLAIPTEGSYFLQVTSLDGKYRTKKRLIHASAPNRNGIGSIPIRSTDLITLKELGGEMLPPQNFIFFKSNASDEITFSWRFPKVLGALEEPEYEFRLLYSENGKDLYNHRTTATSVSVPLSKLGTYEWQVTAHWKDRYQKSKFQMLSYLETSKQKDPMAIFFDNLKNRQPGTVYLSNKAPE